MNNDLISREALKKVLKEKFDDFIPEGVYDEIDNAPTVDTYTIEDIQEVRENALILGAKLAQRPQGEWIEHHIKGKDFFGNGFICECGRIVKQKENFCPNCGADMRGGAE